jgi:hypothetical protein
MVSLCRQEMPVPGQRNVMDKQKTITAVDLEIFFWPVHVLCME